MKIGTHFNPAISNWIRNILKIVHSEFLRYHIYNLIAGRYVGLVLIVYQLINFRLHDFFLGILPYDITPGLKAFNMMAGNTDIHFRNGEIRIACITVFQRRLNGLYGLVYIQYHPMLYAVTVCPAKS